MMSQSRGDLSNNKRKRDSKDLNPDERAILNLIRSKGDMGIVKTDITKELKMTIPKVTNSIKSLQTKQMIKEVPDIQCKGKKRLLAAEFEPSKDLTGGVWYDNGRLDTHLIETLKQVSLKALADQKIATPDGIRHFLNRVMTGDLTVVQVKEILDNLILEKKIVKVRSNGLGEFAAFPMGADCYKLKQREEKVGAMASIPCGACPRINHCAPDGIISPTTCQYYTKWLDF